jgi:uncharacterized protein
MKNLLWQIPLRFDFTVEDVQPILRVAKMRSPLLIASGENDQHTRIAETKRIFDSAPQPKRLWIVPEAGHVDLHAFRSKSYEETIADFFQTYLR